MDGIFTVILSVILIATVLTLLLLVDFLLVDTAREMSDRLYSLHYTCYLLRSNRWLTGRNKGQEPTKENSSPDGLSEILRYRAFWLEPWWAIFLLI